jgi:hypothetical protein
MRYLLIKILFAIAFPKSYRQFQPKDFDEEKVSLWLANSFQEDGYRMYYVAKDRQLMRDMASGMEGKDYWVSYGRRMALFDLMHEMEVKYKKEKARK